MRGDRSYLIQISSRSIPSQIFYPLAVGSGITLIPLILSPSFKTFKSLDVVAIMTSSTSVPSNAPSIQIPAVVFCVVSPLIVAIRFWARLRNGANLGIDDWLILLSLVRLLGSAQINLVLIN